MKEHLGFHFPERPTQTTYKKLYHLKIDRGFQDCTLGSIEDYLAKLCDGARVLNAEQKNRHIDEVDFPGMTALQCYLAIYDIALNRFIP